TAVPDRRLQDVADPDEPAGAVRLSEPHRQDEAPHPGRERGQALWGQEGRGTLLGSRRPPAGAPDRAGRSTCRSRSASARSTDAARVHGPAPRRVAAARLARLAAIAFVIAPA